MVIQHNMGASNASRMYNITNSSLSRESEKLSSGYKINRSADDAAGLSISEKMRRQIRGLRQSSKNGGDGISLAQIADGALTEVHDMLQRANELAVQAANGTLSSSDRKNVNAEIEKLKEEIDAITSRTKFNEIKVFDKNGTTPKIRKLTATDSQSRAVDALATKIADEYYPNAVAQILENITSIGNKINALAETNKPAYNTELKIDYIDGVSNTLAYMQAGFWNDGTFAEGSLLMKVDKDDFPDLNLSYRDQQMLESTIAHEVMHGVMDVAFPNRMYSNSSTGFPKWFKEGTAQLTGGGYTTGWNDTLMTYANQLSSLDDTSKDSAIASYLQSYTVDNREYGHGYLAAAYACYLAASGNDVSTATLLSGANKIFGAFIDDETSSFDSIMENAMGVSVSDLKGAINGGSTATLKSGKMSAVEFVRQLTYMSKNGAGSITAGSLATGGTDIIGTSAKKNKQPLEITNVSTNYIALEGNGKTMPFYTNVSIHMGTDADMNNKQEIALYNMSCEALTISKTNVLTEDKATSAIDEFGNAILIVSGVRSYFGAVQNRLEHSIKNLDNVVENTDAAESRIRDADMADEMVKYSKDKILAQAGEAMLAQANTSADNIVNLLR
ncbi:MAG: flagellinolysin [Pseudobutyrivibrio sp.]|nr:flagellinolysin [Pseudobutyrivibrio sp.]